MAVYNKRSGISTVFGLFSVDPLPIPVLVLVTSALILLLAPWFLSFELGVKPTKGNTHLLLLATSLVLVMLVRWLSFTEVSFVSLPRSEAFLPYTVAVLVVVLVIMGQYQNKIHGKWLVGLG